MNKVMDAATPGKFHLTMKMGNYPMDQSDKWDRRFMAMAGEVATWSKDPEAKVGCIVVSPDRRMWTGGYNGFPAGIEDSDYRLSDGYTKNKLMVHAELNALLNARANLTGWTLYVTKPPCLECAKAVVQAGISKVLCPPLEFGSTWRPVQEEAKDLLQEAGVAYVEMFR